MLSHDDRGLDTRPLLSRLDTENEGPTPQAYGSTTAEPSSGTDAASVCSDASDELQDGVRRIEAVSLTWSKRGLILAYLR